MIDAMRSLSVTLALPVETTVITVPAMIVAMFYSVVRIKYVMIV